MVKIKTPLFIKFLDDIKYHLIDENKKVEFYGHHTQFLPWGDKTIFIIQCQEVGMVFSELYQNYRTTQ